MKASKVIKEIKRNPTVRSLNKKSARLAKSAKKNITKIKRSAFKKPAKSKTPSVLAAVLLIVLGIVAIGAYFAKWALGPIVIEDEDLDFE